MSLVRTIGRWAFTALVVNTIIGSGIFGIPSELNAIVGRASAPVPAMASETQRVASYELTLKAGPLPVQSFDAI